MRIADVSASTNAGSSHDTPVEFREPPSVTRRYAPCVGDTLLRNAVHVPQGNEVFCMNDALNVSANDEPTKRQPMMMNMSVESCGRAGVGVSQPASSRNEKQTA